ncbi:superinfection immunity protein [Microbulbifer echini]|uniref:Superinfection immunity protein n=1 Tax=Microbulbifer echini TaxID=1529067 RepID=A0ABV4NNX3_9GAMM
MFTRLEELTASFMDILSGINPLKGSLFVLLFLAVSFLPAIIAFFFNRKHFTKILVANVPAILSWVAWFALLAWAITGQVRKPKEGKVHTVDKDDDVQDASPGKGMVSTESQ